MSVNSIFARTAKYDQKSFFLIFGFHWIWAEKYVFNTSDI